ncbi:hypothetical protein EV182_002865 [Spiromyces aspiralis]|uniref:Uncharacterized protein n=1 Tax=Spiromyces aspiralis TaxID=68401 RepID=A0ACC1HDJ7_9FUNG|nr:hypothetical protein EV182_002865 [Spiromyces aspiralis]
MSSQSKPSISPIPHSPPNSSDSERQQDSSDPAAAKRETLYKTELCSSWTRNGQCRYGNKCRFAHGKCELRERPRHHRYRTKLCRNFTAKGYCPYGDRCDFIHARAEGDGLASAHDQHRDSIIAPKLLGYPHAARSADAAPTARVPWRPRNNTISTITAPIRSSAHPTAGPPPAVHRMSDSMLIMPTPTTSPGTIDAGYADAQRPALHSSLTNTEVVVPSAPAKLEQTTTAVMANVDTVTVPTVPDPLAPARNSANVPQLSSPNHTFRLRNLQRAVNSRLNMVKNNHSCAQAAVAAATTARSTSQYASLATSYLGQLLRLDEEVAGLTIAASAPATNPNGLLVSPPSRSVIDSDPDIWSSHLGLLEGHLYSNPQDSPSIRDLDFPRAPAKLPYIPSLRSSDAPVAPTIITTIPTTPTPPSAAAATTTTTTTTTITTANNATVATAAAATTTATVATTATTTNICPHSSPWELAADTDNPLVVAGCLDTDAADLTGAFLHNTRPDRHHQHYNHHPHQQPIICANIGNHVGLAKPLGSSQTHPSASLRFTLGLNGQCDDILMLTSRPN